jgi:methylated-DNA-[protein]-cysteine S-methyltransferase
MAVAYHDDLIAAVSFGHHSAEAATRRLNLNRFAETMIEPAEAATEPAAQAIAGLKSYAAGNVVQFDGLVLDFRGLTSFQRRVLRACRRIPWGQTVTYSQLAARVKSPRAARAVGSVMAGNRFPIIVPCHRVIAGDGSLGGYSAPSGLKMKKRLLELEGSQHAPRARRAK